jgi:hypothetical protein
MWSGARAPPGSTIARSIQLGVSAAQAAMRPSKELSRRSRSAGRFKRPTASYAVITKLIELGYLKPKDRYHASAIEKAIGRLGSDLIRARIVLR